MNICLKCDFCNGVFDWNDVIFVEVRYPGVRKPTVYEACATCAERINQLHKDALQQRQVSEENE